MNCNELSQPLKQGDRPEVTHRAWLRVVVTTDHTQHLPWQRRTDRSGDPRDTNVPILLRPPAFTPLLTLIRPQKKARYSDLRTNADSATWAALHFSHRSLLAASHRAHTHRLGTAHKGNSCNSTLSARSHEWKLYVTAKLFTVTGMHVFTMGSAQTCPASSEPNTAGGENAYRSTGKVSVRLMSQGNGKRSSMGSSGGEKWAKWIKCQTTGWDSHETACTPRKRAAFPPVRTPRDALPGITVAHRRRERERTLTGAHGSGWDLSYPRPHNTEWSCPLHYHSACVSVARGSTSLTFWEREGHQTCKQSQPRDALRAFSRRFLSLNVRREIPLWWVFIYQVLPIYYCI